MTATASIREISDADVEPIKRLWHQAGVTRPWNDPDKDFSFARRGPHSTILVAVLNERVVATAMVGEDGHRGWAYYVAVEPELQGQGLGRLIMQGAEDWLARRGVWKLQVMIRQENTQVKTFYEELGYHDTHTITLQKALKPGGTSV